MKNFNRLKISLLALSLTVFSCNSMHRSAEKATHNEGEHTKHWSYTGEESPEHWSNISNEYKACDGDQQSPINIDTKTVSGSAKHVLDLNYSSSAVDIINNGHTEEFVTTGENYLIFDGKRFDLKQFHMHTLSEHTLDGKHFPLELHFVNKAEDGTYAVISVLVEEGMESDFFAHYLSKFPKEEGEYKADETFTFYEVMSCNEHYYHYKGSFTTPPCTEVVDWIILKEPLTASKKQLEALHQLMGDNYRPTQPLNHRKIEAQ